jgi:phosphoenolpyruvate carboxykinase (ATP)
VFGFDVVTECPNVPREILTPRESCADGKSYESAARKLAGLFVANFKQYEAGAGSEVKSAGPVV